MPNKEMPKEVSIMGGCPVPSMCSPLLILAEVEAEGKAKKARLRAQQRGRVAKGKKGRLGAALRHLWGKSHQIKNEWIFEEDCYLSRRSHSRRKIHRAEQPGRPERSGESGNALRQLPPEEKKG